MRPPIAASLLLSGLVALGACRPAPVVDEPEPESEVELSEEGSGADARWTYEIRLDQELERMNIGLCIEGQLPRRLIAGPEALGFVRSARVRGGPALDRGRESLEIATLGAEGCVDIEIDIDRATSSTGRDSGRRGDTLMLAPDRWLWYPALVPDRLEARARFDLPEGVAATTPWPRIDDDDPGEWRSLDPTSFGWNAWAAFGRYQPLEFRAAECDFEVAVLAGGRRATDAGIEAWLRTAAETGAQLYGRFPRDHVSVVVVPASAWGDSPVVFGMARRGGGGSVMLMLDDSAEDHELPGEWVAIHELLHLGMPLVTEPWMSEGFVTYYTHVLRARAGLLDAAPDKQVEAGLEILHRGFQDRPGPRTLAAASASMRRYGNYHRVYWGGAALAYDLDVSIRLASDNRRSLDDLMRDMASLAPVHRRWAADELFGRMDTLVDAWRGAEQITLELSPSEIAARHLEAKVTPLDVQALRGLAVATDNGRIRLLADPIDQVTVRNGLLSAKVDELPGRQ